ncbi:MAG: hypothetical protein R3B57_00870 [Phycisphaerales bacterium]
MRLARGLALVVLALASSLARAQAPASDPDQIAIEVSWGFSGAMVAERWSPVRFNISTGSRAVSGEVRITYRQDAAQDMAIALPFATTPGKTVPIEAALALPLGCDLVRVRVIDDRGKRLASMDFRSDADDPALFLPNILTSEGATVLELGGTTLPVAALAIQQRPPGKEWDDPPGAGTWWPLVSVWRVNPDHLPTSWMSYDGVSAIVIEARQLTSLRPDVLLALRRWLESGGAMVVLAADAGDGWSLIAPRVEGEAIASLAPATSVSRPSELRPLVREAAEEIAARPITLSPAAERLGWRARWELRHDAGALLIEGPVGFGWLTILGTRPERVPKVASDAEAAAIWRNALNPSVGRWIRPREGRVWYNQWGASGATPQHQGAIASILDHILRVPTPGLGVFIVLVLFIVLLAALVGPVDAIVLKKLRRRQLSWATALAYTLVASVLAAGIPVAMRSGNTIYSRASCVDVLAPQLGSRAERSALSSVFAATSGRVGVENPAPGSWWRPVSALASYFDVPAGPTLSTLQSARATPTGVVRENVPDPAIPGALRLWTLRTTLDQGPTSAPLVSIEAGERPSECRVRLIGLDGVERITQADVRLPARTKQRWTTPATTIESDGVTITFDAAAIGMPAPPRDWLPADKQDDDTDWEYAAGAAYRPARFLDLPGAWRRTSAIDQYAVYGQCALIYLELWRAAPDVSITRPADVATLEVYRVVVPLPEEPAP